MGYTRRKIRGINFSFLLAGMVFAGWALVCAWFGWPRGLRYGSTAAFCLFSAAALFFVAFPVIWARFPDKHPVNHELARYGRVQEMSERLDLEISEHVEAFGPFRFTASYLVYDSGHEFQLIPYGQIVSSEIAADDVPSLIVRTRRGRRYQWFRAWMQGTFDPEIVLAKIRSVAPANDERRTTSDDPSPASQSPSATS
jgi:hypothetical protein